MIRGTVPYLDQNFSGRGLDGGTCLAQSKIATASVDFCVHRNVVGYNKARWGASRSVFHRSLANMGATEWQSLQELGGGAILELEIEYTSMVSLLVL